MKVIYDSAKQRVPIKSWCENPEQGAVDQAIALSNHPAVFKHVALMPDTHLGMGMPIGGVTALDNAISPSAVGVDIGCGMCAVQTGHTISEVQGKLKAIREGILKAIPVGFAHRKPTNFPTLDALCAIHHDIIDTLETFTAGNVGIDAVRGQIGTLGGGNHFIEVQKDADDKVWIMIHSGSRNIGKQIADIYHKLAARLNNQWRSACPPSLAFFPYDSDAGREYYAAMSFALDFAYDNRLMMMNLVHQVFEYHGLGWDFSAESLINIHHNYASLEHHFGKNVMVHRKGATLARSGVTCIIPGSMGTSSHICDGLGNPESFHSCSHGAGRVMSRGKAKRNIPLKDFADSMKGIEYTPVADNLDEAPQAYKDIDVVMRQQADLVSSRVKLSPIAVVKG